MVSSETGKIGIIAEAKKEDNKAPAIRYSSLREAVKAFLIDPKRDKSILYAAEAKFEQAKTDPTLSKYQQSDAASSLEALHAFQSMMNQIGGMEYYMAPQGQPKLEINGVTVSINLDLLIRADKASNPRVGGTLFRFTQADDETEAAAMKRRDMGSYAATLVHMHVLEHFSDNATVHNSICYAVDVQFKEAINAPKTYAQRARNIENACKFISAIWDSV